MKVVIESIPYRDMRYPTSGDWWWEDSTLQIRVAAMSNNRHEWLIAIHELVEAWLCRDRGVDASVVDAWVEQGGMGDDVLAPHHREHDAGLVFERWLAHELGVHWEVYSAAFEEMP